ncbi:MAG: single-stranded DNA-binding protein [Cyanobacteriota bacterium]|nr:single-stranded DNA-binding protein [Cyanobacteriota bacterium]
MNHCLLEVEVVEAPKVRYTQDNQTPVAEMAVRFDGLRPDDPPAELKVVGWGNLAQDLQNRVNTGQRLVIEGRLRMNTVTRQDGVKEKRAEFTLARLHPLMPSGAAPSKAAPSGAPPSARPAGQAPASAPARKAMPAPRTAAPAASEAAWNASPLVPDLLEGEDEIPF